VEVRALIKSVLFNLIFAAVVFLPVFLIASAVELRLRGGPPFEGDFRYQASSAAVIYLTMLIPALLAPIRDSTWSRFDAAGARAPSTEWLALAAESEAGVTFVIARNEEVPGGSAALYFGGRRPGPSRSRRVFSDRG